jgi:phosphohistidine phosphatase SixA
MPSPRRFATAFSLLLALLPLWPLAGQAADAALVEALRGGGFVLYFRHAETDWSQTDRRHEAGWDSCDPAQMRQLSAAGRETARRVGEALRRLRIPVGRVVASEFCRTRETARLLALGAVETSRDLVNVTHAGQAGGTEALRQRARRLLATPPPAGTNVVLVSHGNVFMLVAEQRPVEGGAAILRPDGEGGFEIVAHVAPEDWRRLAAMP